jgi:hypothetical protein
MSAAKPAACSALLLLGAVVVIGFGAGTAHAREAGAASGHSWCVARGGTPLQCGHSDVVTCSLAALVTAGYCVKAEPPSSPATTVAVAPPRAKRSAPRRKLSASQRDELFHEFERWKRTTAQ